MVLVDTSKVVTPFRNKNFKGDEKETVDKPIPTQVQMTKPGGDANDSDILAMGDNDMPESESEALDSSLQDQRLPIKQVPLDASTKSDGRDGPFNDLISEINLSQDPELRLESLILES